MKKVNLNILSKKPILGIGIVALLMVFGFIHSLQAQSAGANLTDLIAQLQSSPDDQELRKKIIKLVSTMSTKPEMPDELNELLGQAKYVMKNAKVPEDYNDAVDAFKKASLLAPWVGDIYYNLGVAQEKAENQADAIDSFSFYLLAKPHAKDKAAVEEKIGALKYVAKKNDFDGAVFSSDQNGCPQGGCNTVVHYSFSIHGNEVTWSEYLTGVTEEGYQNGWRDNVVKEDGVFQLSGRRFTHNYPSGQSETWAISPDGQSISKLDENGNPLFGKYDVYKRTSSQ